MLGVSATLAVSLLVTHAFVQTYPEWAIIMVVPFSAGDPTDTMTLLVGEAMSKDLQEIVVENVGGAGCVASAGPDGYTLAASYRHGEESQTGL